MSLLACYSPLQNPFTRLSVLIVDDIVCEVLVVNFHHFVADLDHSCALVVMAVELLEGLKVHFLVFEQVVIGNLLLGFTAVELVLEYPYLVVESN